MPETQELERCTLCDDTTGRAGGGDDSLYVDDHGPFCSACFEPFKAGHLAAHLDREADADALMDRTITQVAEHLGLAMGDAEKLLDGMKNVHEQIANLRKIETDIRAGTTPKSQ